MGFFCILREHGQPGFSVEKLDINIWLMPGLLRTEMLYCDLGIKIRMPAGESKPPEKISFSLGLPFLADGDSVTDLADLFFGPNESNSRLVFANRAETITPENSNSTTTVRGLNDGDSDLVVCPIVAEESIRLQQSKKPYSIWKIVVQNRAAAGQDLYTRVRFRVSVPGVIWQWRNDVRRRAFAIADVRVNEFRNLSLGLPAGRDFTNEYMPISAVNLFFVASARLKAGRVSPAQDYVRLLEQGSWDEYLKRRLDRSRDIFVINYWRKENVDRDAPFRAFLEVERRQPTAVGIVLVGAVIVLLGFVLVSPSFSFTQSLLWNSLSSIWSWLTSVVAVIGLGVLVRLAVGAVAKREWARRLWRKAEAKRFSITP